MTIYLLRHGRADSVPPGSADQERRLAPEGAEAVERVMERARAAGVAPALIVTSTYARAVETAEIAARVLGYRAPVERTPVLAPMLPPYDAWDEIRTRNPEGDVLIAGHEPLLSALAAFLLDSPALHLDMQTATLAAITIDRLSPQPAGVLRWMLTPAVA